jgi:hypothetical protein
VRADGGGTSGMSIFLLFIRSVMGDSPEHLRCQAGKDAICGRN